MFFLDLGLWLLCVWCKCRFGCFVLQKCIMMFLGCKLVWIKLFNSSICRKVLRFFEVMVCWKILLLFVINLVKGMLCVNFLISIFLVQNLVYGKGKEVVVFFLKFLWNLERLVVLMCKFNCSFIIFLNWFILLGSESYLMVGIEFKMVVKNYMMCRFCWIVCLILGCRILMVI